MRFCLLALVLIGCDGSAAGPSVQDDGGAGASGAGGEIGGAAGAQMSTGAAGAAVVPMVTWTFTNACPMAIDLTIGGKAVTVPEGTCDTVCAPTSDCNSPGAAATCFGYSNTNTLYCLDQMVTKASCCLCRLKGALGKTSVTFPCSGAGACWTVAGGKQNCSTCDSPDPIPLDCP